MNVLTEKKLGNGLSLTISEDSRAIAADRWYVKVIGAIFLPLTDADWAGIGEDDPAMLARVRGQLGEAVEYQLLRDRNFVDAAVKDEVVRELVAQLVETVGAYLEVEDFPVRLLAKKYREAREICRVAMGREEAAGGSVDEPADFSHCFR